MAGTTLVRNADRVVACDPDGDAHVYLRNADEMSPYCLSLS